MWITLECPLDNLLMTYKVLRRVRGLTLYLLDRLIFHFF